MFTHHQGRDCISDYSNPEPEWCGINENMRKKLHGKAAKNHTSGSVTDAFDQVRHASAYNRSLIEASLDPLVTINPDGTISDVNAATVKITGFSREELIGTDFS